MSFRDDWGNMRGLLLGAGLTLAMPGAAFSDDAFDEAFVEANLIATFYHELGHGLIDILNLPIYGQEEDAADNASVLLVDALFDEEDAIDISVGAAEGYLLAALEMEDSDEEVPYWDSHGPDLQRYYNIACLIYGADVERRATLPDELDLPEERAEFCEEEFEQANNAWGPVLDRLERRGGNQRLRLDNREAGDEMAEFIAEIVSDDIASVNQNFTLPAALTVVIEYCDEPNAFYDPEDREIIMCVELAEEFANLAERYPPDN